MYSSLDEHWVALEFDSYELCFCEHWCTNIFKSLLWLLCDIHPELELLYYILIPCLLFWRTTILTFISDELCLRWWRVSVGRTEPWLKVIVDRDFSSRNLTDVMEKGREWISLGREKGRCWAKDWVVGKRSSEGIQSMRQKRSNQS